MNFENQLEKGSTNKLQTHFAAGIKLLMEPLGWGAQKKIAGLAGITPSFLNDIVKERRFGSEQTRRAIARALGVTYEDVLKAGAEIFQNKSSAIGNKCGKHPMFSENRASCIYQLAAESAGLRMSHFFTDEALKKVQPPGWIEYLNKEIDDDELLRIGLEEMGKLMGNL